jgi:hypothetical protein
MDTAPRIRFEYCISFFFVTIRRQSQPVVLKPGDSLFLAALPYNLITLFLGWWGIPWGLMVTPVVLFRNLTGGIVEPMQTDEVARSAESSAPAQSPSS